MDTFFDKYFKKLVAAFFVLWAVLFVGIIGFYIFAGYKVVNGIQGYCKDNNSPECVGKVLGDINKGMEE